MRTLLRYLLISGAVVGLAYALFVVRIGDRSVFGHLRSAGQGDVGNVIARFKADLDRRLEDLREANAPLPKRTAKKQGASKPQQAVAERPKLSGPEQKANERQVAKLREAEQLVSSRGPVGKPAPVKRAEVDEHIADRHKKAIDRLIR